MGGETYSGERQRNKQGGKGKNYKGSGGTHKGKSSSIKGGHNLQADRHRKVHIIKVVLVPT